MDLKPVYIKAVLNRQVCLLGKRRFIEMPFFAMLQNGGK
ncbi:hypothetical protein J2Z29_000973 [Treponema pedis]|uniref:Uncharacterized protein n=1 Tax=Treponema pedis str. T A4 TaxID=1291379 RepID=S6A2Q7_9SPIR|nr:hypothetical protein TPE_0390 [Treponema pedis str. T A4]